MNKSLCRLAAFALIAYAFLVVGCSDSVPSERQIEKALTQQILAESLGSVKLTHFEKVNGQKSNIAGIQLYDFDYKCEIEFQEDCWWTDSDAFGYWTGHFFVAHGASAYATDKKNKGYRLTITSKFKFEKTEKGWRDQNGKILGMVDEQAEAAIKIALLREKALQGDPESEVTLGKMYLGGVGITRNDAEGRRLIELAASQDFPQAKIELLLLQAKR